MSLPYNAVPWIRNARCASIAYQSDVHPAFHSIQQEPGLLAFVMLVVARSWLLDAMVRQQSCGVPCVLACDQVHLAQYTQRSERDVFQVANRCGDHIKRAGHV